ncbi:sigma-E factor negative regulatory protein [Vibrio vulnificus]|jgi:sigma-E factor negative regulatory protein RseA|uniref:Anti-sigma-E factor RseA n=2 Tax=Vibrio vulnificus TaxID=672 RepID=A0A3Q0L3X6_VIBVU|nr:sigma-E factor negative regulatory protein [Vibrio vulnificus]OJI59583.1 Anti-sigma-E factor RseA [Vibrio fluvialis]AAO09984.1 Sigma factor RpoE negative regulatory protein RseA [Vibrio vulnificus CMCP6]AIL71623.1 negative regulator of sigma E activity [Vibrio vulnificus]AXX58780.1 Sigma factor RpoE negative regulatory protein RseA [Vibrio vulnificus]EGQ7699243.1 sigma-E factor negative regulatory protein [Vibrio vulnificus]
MADKEKLSALMDGEIVDKALIKEIAQDDDVLASWRNYHLIGDVMRGEAPQQPEWNIAESVALALENEPAHSLHQQKVIELTQMPPESQPLPQQARRQLPTWLSQFGQVAVAACVSLAVILGVQQYGGSDPAAPQADQLPVLQTIPFAGSAEPVSLTRESVEKSMSESSIQEQRKRVHAMLRDYELQLRLNSDSSHIAGEQSTSEIE